ncbi:MAG: hypothetical protein ACRD3W_20485, partial [Terriglobales bacterium]
PRPCRSLHGPDMNILKRFRLFLNVVAIVAVLVAVKLAIHAFGYEFLKLDALFPSIVASSIFIIGFLLSSLIPDYKEAERTLAEIRMALEGIHDDVFHFAEKTPGVDIETLRLILAGIVTALEEGLGRMGAHSDVSAAIELADRLSPIFARLETLGMSQNFIVRLRGEQDVLRKCLYRIHYIQKMEFIPSVHVLIQTLVCATLFLLLFLKTEGSFETAFIFGFVSYMFIYALHLITVLEQPFAKGEHSIDDVSFFLLRDFAAKLGRLNGR